MNKFRAHLPLLACAAFAVSAAAAPAIAGPQQIDTLSYSWGEWGGIHDDLPTPPLAAPGARPSAGPRIKVDLTDVLISSSPPSPKKRARPGAQPGHGGPAAKLKSIKGK